MMQTMVDGSACRALSAPAAAPAAEAGCQAVGAAPPSQSAAVLVQASLQPGSTVDFPQITEICDRIEVRPEEVAEAVEVLAGALRSTEGPLRMQLQALTISNEMMYNANARTAFRAAHGVQDALLALRRISNTELGAVTDGTVRMLATEIYRVCFTEGRMEEMPRRSTSRTFSSKKMMNSNLARFERARLEAKKTLETAMLRAEKTFERTAIQASSAMQKAEKAMGRRATMALEDFERSYGRTAALAAAGSSAAGDARQRLRELEMTTAEIVKRIHETEAKAVKAEDRLKLQVAKEGPMIAEHEELLRQLEESELLVSFLTTKVTEAAIELEEVEEYNCKLEAELSDLVTGAGPEATTELEEAKTVVEAPQGDGRPGVAPPPDPGPCAAAASAAAEASGSPGENVARTEATQTEEIDRLREKVKRLEAELAARQQQQQPQQ